MRFLLALSLVSSACSSDKDSGDGGTGSDGGGDTGSSQFLSQTTLQDSSIDQNAQCDWQSYWPAMETTNPIYFARFDAPTPPYEIQSLAVALYNDPSSGFGTADCTSAVPVRLLAFVDAAEDLSAYELTSGTWPEMPAAAEGTVVGLGEKTDEGIELLTVELATPVRIEDAGYLYVGFEMVEEGADIACVLGCGSKGQTGFTYYVQGNDWSQPAGWTEVDGIPDVRATVAY